MDDTTKDAPTEDPRAAEAKGTDIEIEWRGHTYRVPRDYGKWPYAYSLNAERGLSTLALAALLGPEQHAQFLRGAPTIDDFNEFDARLAAALKLEPGESPASSS